MKGSSEDEDEGGVQAVTDAEWDQLHACGCGCVGVCSGRQAAPCGKLAARHGQGGRERKRERKGAPG